MKAEIEKLIELAGDYVVLANGLGLPMTHNSLRSLQKIRQNDMVLEGNEIGVYLAAGGVWQVSFDKVVIIGYSNTVQIPFDCSKEYLSAVYDDCVCYLNEHLLPNVAKLGLATMKERQIKIKELEREIKELKSLH